MRARSDKHSGGENYSSVVMSCKGWEKVERAVEEGGIACVCTCVCAPGSHLQSRKKMIMKKSKVVLLACRREVRKIEEDNK